MQNNQDRTPNKTLGVGKQPSQRPNWAAHQLPAKTVGSSRYKKGKKERLGGARCKGCKGLSPSSFAFLFCCSIVLLLLTAVSAMKALTPQAATCLERPRVVDCFM